MKEAAMRSANARMKSVELAEAVNTDATTWLRADISAFATKVTLSIRPIPRNALMSTSANLLGTIALRFAPIETERMTALVEMGSSSAITSAGSAVQSRVLSPSCFLALEMKFMDKSLSRPIIGGNLTSFETRPGSPDWTLTQGPI